MVDIPISNNHPNLIVEFPKAMKSNTCSHHSIIWNVKNKECPSEREVIVVEEFNAIDKVS